MQFLIKSTPQAERLIFNAIKAKILKHLERLEKEEAEGVQKAFSELTSLMIKGGKGLPVGTIREWKGKKFIKVAPGKWKPKYESHSHGAKLAIAALKKKIAACDDSSEMMRLILENRDRFSDANGNPLPFVQELSSFIEQMQNMKEKKAQTGADSSESSDSQSGKTEMEELLAAVNSDGENKRDFQFIFKDAQHLKDIKRIIDDFEKNPPKESERDQLESYVRQHERERKRFQTIYNKEGDNAALALAHKHTDLRNVYNWQLTKLDKKHTPPEREQSGDEDNGNSNDGYPEKDYSEYKGKGQKAVDFIVKQQGGQVRGAFNRPEIGDIDVVWGKVTNAEKHEGYGLAHIIDKHGIEAVKKIGEIVKAGQLVTDEANNRISIEQNGYHLGLRQQWNGKKKIWIVTNLKKGGTTKTTRSNSNYAEQTLSATSSKRGTTETSYSNSDYTGETLPETSPKSVPQSEKKSSVEKKNTKTLTFKATAAKTLYQNATMIFITDTLNDKDILRAYASNLLARWHCDNSIRSKLYNETPHHKIYLLNQAGSKDVKMLIEKELEKRNIKIETIWVNGLTGSVYFELKQERNITPINKSIAELEAAFESFQKSRNAGALSPEPAKPFVRQKGVKYVLIAQSPCPLLESNSAKRA